MYNYYNGIGAFTSDLDENGNGKETRTVSQDGHEKNIECILVTHMDNFFVLLKYWDNYFFKAKSPHSCQIHQQDS